MNATRNRYDAKSGIIKALFIAGLAIGAGVATCHAQLPQPPTARTIPGASRNSSSDIKPSERGTPEVHAISPGRVLPGPFDLTITGANLLPNMPVWLDCHEARDGKAVDNTYFKLEAKGVTAKGTDGIVAHFEPPASPAEAICNPMSTYGQNMTLLITSHANDPRLLAGTFIAEGANLDPMSLAMKMGDVAQRYTKEKLLLTPARLQYVQQDGKILFDRPLSDIKSVGPVMINGNASDMFQIAFNDGKTYAFAPMGQGEDAQQALKSALHP